MPIHPAAAVAVLATGLLACESGRERPIGEGVHPDGWAIDGDPAFHGPAMVDLGYPLDECRGCHGADLGGGDVGIGCGDAAGCHVEGVDDCAGTCHGDGAGPLPDSGRHQTHIARVDGCESCHPVPGRFGDGFEGGDHLDGTVEVALASWDPASRACADACHFDRASPEWESDAALGCDGCHQQSPAHDRFADVVSEETCGGCHGGSPEVGHINFVLTIAVDRCDACHGSGPLGAPASGAHRRHLDPLMPGRIGKVVPCSGCHRVPGDVLAAGHLDASGPADVDVVLGDYDAATGRCAAACHFDRQPGPLWTDDTGAELACDACHGFPPVNTRIGTRHPPSAPQLSVCTGCHSFAAPTHVDGEVNFR